LSAQPIPDKLYFKIGEVGELTGVEPHVLRYWESEFKELRPHRAGSKQRLYRRADVEMVLAIKRLLYGEGFTIAGAKKFLGRRSKDEAGEEAPAAEPEGLLQEIRSELEELRRLLEK
jgi:DNA-binding transcriptional MerR regulator